MVHGRTTSGKKMKGGKLRDCGEGPALPFTKKSTGLRSASIILYY